MLTKLKFIRMSAGLTQRRLAEMAGCHPATLAQIEQGRRPASARLHKAIMDALGSEKWKDERVFDERGFCV